MIPSRTKIKVRTEGSSTGPVSSNNKSVTNRCPRQIPETRLLRRRETIPRTHTESLIKVQTGYVGLCTRVGKDSGSRLTRTSHETKEKGTERYTLKIDETVKRHSTSMVGGELTRESSRDNKRCCGNPSQEVRDKVMSDTGVHFEISRNSNTRRKEGPSWGPVT